MNIQYIYFLYMYVCMYPDYEVVQLLINILQFNYPETLESALIVDSPFLFYACWAVIRPWLGTVHTYITSLMKIHLGYLLS